MCSVKNFILSGFRKFCQGYFLAGKEVKDGKINYDTVVKVYLKQKQQRKKRMETYLRDKKDK